MDPVYCSCHVVLTPPPGPVVVAEDEHPRPNTTAEGLAKLRPAFDKACGSVTAGNASGINDGAAAVVMASRSAAERLGLSAPLARVVSWAQAGVDPAIMGTGPIPAVRKAVSVCREGGGEGGTEHTL